MRYSCFSKEDEERQANFCREKATSTVFETTANFTNSAILMEIQW